ncbi:MAG: glycosyl hydrolase [Gammaproteobacteria bacterium]
MNRIAMVAVSLVLTLSAYSADPESKPKPGLNDETFAGLELRGIGPAFMSGRIADIAIDPKDTNVRYLAVGSGGVWKTSNAGITWDPIFDGQGSFSIGAVTIDPNNSQTVWVGTGENVSGRHVGFGDGVYVSHDGGGSWSNVGLKKSERIGMIRVDPRDSNTVFVAAQGPLWSSGGERGLYKTTDGGENWKRVLKANQWTGAGEVHMHPENPDVLYATTWQRLRSVAALMNGGPDTGIHKSVDGGETWTELTNGLPTGDMGKIGMAISPMKPEVVYATIEQADRKGGVYRSDNGGASWEKMSDFVSSGTGPHYYQELFASPHTFDKLYHMDVFLHISDDGGKNFVRTKYNDKHVDHHALAFLADDPDYLVVGTDGGLYETFDSGNKWRFTANLPLTQFYKVAIDFDLPFYNVYGGTQDNNSQGGPSRTDNWSGILNSDWFVTLGGDGHQSAVDPSNPDIIYAQWQQGNLTRFDRKTGEAVYIKPQPAADEPAERFNWDAPILISPHDPAVLYFASSRVWRSPDRGDSWKAISGDLSQNIDRLREPMMGRQWNDKAAWDLYAMSMFGTVTSLSESPIEKGLLYAGTDDGLIHISDNGGDSWTKIDSLPGVADNFFVNDIKADLHDKDTVYVAVDQHKNGDFSPYLFKSTDRGRSWRSITSNLPERHITWRVVQDHVKPELLFAGTEFGVFFTIDGGKRWVKLTGNAPTISFRDLVIQPRENDLVGATFGRGFYIFDDYSVLRHIDGAKLESEAQLFPVRKTPWYIPKGTLGCDQPGCRASGGGSLFVAPNPDFGALITYYLPEEIQTSQAARHAEELERAKEGENTPFPSWDTLNEEALESDPAVVLIIKDAQGNTINQVTGPTGAGFHRVAWDLTLPSKSSWEPPEDPTPWNSPPVGPMAAPGQYSVTFGTRVNGELKMTDQTQTFMVESIRTPTLAGSSQEDRLAFSAKTEELTRQITTTDEQISAAIASLKAAADTLRRYNAAPELLTDAQALTRKLTEQSRVINGDANESRYNSSTFVSIWSRAFVAGSSGGTTYGPTETMRMSLDIANTKLGEVREVTTPLLKVELPALMKRLDDAGVPWSKGR